MFFTFSHPKIDTRWRLQCFFLKHTQNIFWCHMCVLNFLCILFRCVFSLYIATCRWISYSIFVLDAGEVTRNYLFIVIFRSNNVNSSLNANAYCLMAGPFWRYLSAREEVRCLGAINIYFCIIFCHIYQMSFSFISFFSDPQIRSHIFCFWYTYCT